jgi:hypothetical protein
MKTRLCIPAPAVMVLAALALPLVSCGQAVPVAGVSLSHSAMRLAVRATGSLTAAVQPSDATNQAVAWASSDPAVASVAGGAGSRAAVVANAAGTAIITVTTQDGGRTASCAVTVAVVPVTGVSLDRSAMGMAVGFPEQLVATVRPGDATNQTVTWTSSDAAVDSVAGAGATATVVANAPGTATITVATQDGGRTATCAVVVSDVYIAGHEHDSSDRARAWHNDVIRTLSNEYNSSARSIFVSGGDVYAAGSVGYDSSACIWKNNAGQRLAPVESGARSIFVSGGDVCVAGYVGFGMNARATVWINGSAQRLSSVQSYASSAQASGGDVYVVGHENDRTGFRATLWINGSPRRLCDVDSQASSVFVSGGDVYVAGYTDGSARCAMLWKNGVPQTLGGDASYARSVFVSGGDVYVAGEEGGRATLWKNGDARLLGDAGSRANSVFVLGDDVYAAGSVSGSGYNRYATLWRNGAPKRLSGGSGLSEAYDVFVK